MGQVHPNVADPPFTSDKGLISGTLQMSGDRVLIIAPCHCVTRQSAHFRRQDFGKSARANHVIVLPRQEHRAAWAAQRGCIKLRKRHSVLAEPVDVWRGGVTPIGAKIHETRIVH